jgi:hypothetical protein
LFTSSYESIVSDFTKLTKRLERFAQREEAKAEAYLDAHFDLKKMELASRTAADKARNTMKNIGKLFD